MAVDAYIICTSPRSGSTLLCRLLAQTRIAGHPESYFHEPSLKAWLQDHGIPCSGTHSERELLGSVFREAIAAGSRGTGMFALRMQRHSFEFFSKQLAILHPGLASDQQRLAAAFGNTAYIHLTRGNKLEQADFVCNGRAVRTVAQIIGRLGVGTLGATTSANIRCEKDRPPN